MIHDYGVKFGDSASQKLRRDAVYG